MSLESSVQTLIASLQAVTARLENVEKSLAAQVSGSAKAAPAAAPAGSAADSAEVLSAPSLVDYDQLIADYIAPYLAHSKTIGGLVAEQAQLVSKAVDLQRALLVQTLKAKKPSDADFLKYFEPTNQVLNQIVELREKNRPSPQFNHLSTISEGINALRWVLVTPTPGPFVAEGRASSEFYSNRVLKEFKGKEQLHVDWVGAWNTFLHKLQAFIKTHHTTGLVWSGNGQLGTAAAAAPAPTPKGPPGPPPAPANLAADVPKPSAKPNTGALFAELNKGTDVTSGLRKVTADMKTKNRPVEERSSVVKAVEKPTAAASKVAGKAPAKVYPPKFALEGNKWLVEYQIGNKSIEIAETEPRHTVYIYRCKNSVVVIKGKINNIIIDDCQGLGVVFDNAISSVESVNSSGVQIQVTGKVPSFSIDKTSSLSLYLSKDCLDAEIITSKSDSLNVFLAPENDHEDGTELPIPEQYKSVIIDRKLVTDVVRHE